MTLELTLGRMTFTVRREPVKGMDKAAENPPHSNSFAQDLTQIFNATWEAKAGACFPKQFSSRHNLTAMDETDE